MPKSGKKVVKNKKKSRSKGGTFKFPVDQIHRLLCEVECANCIKNEASVFLSAALEYLTAELLEGACRFACVRKQNAINPRDLKLALSFDSELNETWPNNIIAEGGTISKYQKM